MLKITPLGLNGLPLVLNHQGGICGESTSNFDYKTFPIAFNRECLIMNASSMKEEYLISAWAIAKNQTKFIAGIANDFTGYFSSNAIRYIALGI